MKTLKQEVGSLAGRDETISMTELRAQPGDIMAQVALGKKFHITHGGKIVGMITQSEPNALELGAEIRRLGLL